MGYSPWGHKESDTTERLSIAHTTEDVRVLILPKVETQHLMLIRKLIAQPGQLRGEYSENFERF